MEPLYQIPDGFKFKLASINKRNLDVAWLNIDWSEICSKYVIAINDWMDKKIHILQIPENGLNGVNFKNKKTDADIYINRKTYIEKYSQFNFAKYKVIIIPYSDLNIEKYWDVRIDEKGITRYFPKF